MNMKPKTTVPTGESGIAGSVDGSGCVPFARTVMLERGGAEGVIGLQVPLT